MLAARDPSSGLTGLVAVRCGNGSTVPVYGSPCLGWNPGKGRLDPAGDYQSGDGDPNGGYSTLSADHLTAPKTTAIANGTYYPTGTCPPAGVAEVVYVENTNCTYTSNTVWNSNAAPGALIFASGTVTFNGTINFYGTICMVN